MSGLVRAAVEGVPFVVDDEVDELRRVTAEEAAALLTYERDRELARSV